LLFFWVSLPDFGFRVLSLGMVIHAAFHFFVGYGGGICVDREVSGAGTIAGAAFGKLDHSSHGHYTRHGYESGQRAVEQCADAG
jgi:hypothetical protein